MIKYLIAIPIVITIFIIGITLFLQPNDFINCGETPAANGPCAKADAIVVVSGGDTNGRTDEGIRLYKQGWASSIIFSGAAQDKSGPSNAAAMETRALMQGVPETSIYTEELSNSTQENAVNTQEILNDNDFSRVILVTSGYHQRRANLEFEKRANNVAILNHPLVNDKDWSGWWWVTPRGWWLAGGEMVKVVAFYVQGGK